MIAPRGVAQSSVLFAVASLCLAALWGGGVSLRAQDVPRPGAGFSELRLRLTVYADAEGRDWLAGEGFDISGYGLSEGWVEVITDSRGAARIRAHGLVAEVAEVREGPRPLEDGTAGPAGRAPADARYTNPREAEDFLRQTNLDHPEITRLVRLGASREDRPIWALMISDNASLDEDELAILFNGAHHAREVMTPEVVLDIVDQLTDNYGSDPDVTARVDAYEIWCVPIVNPDGVEIVHTVDDFWRKNARDNNGDGAVDGFDGVDLNRNYEWGWGFQCRGSSGSIDSQTYRGPSEASEPEAQAIIGLIRRETPVFDVDYHSYGEDVFYSMSCDPVFNPKLTTIVGPDQDISRVIAEDYASRIVQADGEPGYAVAPYGSRVDGTGRDQQYHEGGTIAFVTEINSQAEGGFQPDYGVYRDATVQGLRASWLWLIDRMAGAAVGGHVRDAVTLAPLQADLSLDELILPDGKRLTSRADTGRFHLVVVPGDYTLRVSAPGYEPFVLSLSVTDTFEPVDVLLQPTGAVLLVEERFEDPGTLAGWVVGDPADAATTGIWEWGEPDGTQSGSVNRSDLQRGNARLDRTPGVGKYAFVTGNRIGAGLAEDDVTGGSTTLTSPPMDLSRYTDVSVTWHRWFRNDLSDPGDTMVAEVSADGGNWVAVETLSASTATPDASPAWGPVSIRLDDHVPPGRDARIRFRVTDQGIDNVVEAAIDDLTVLGTPRNLPAEELLLQVRNGNDSVVTWQPLQDFPDLSFDVVRGNLENLSGGPAGVELGPILCIEEDSDDLTTAGWEDADRPGAGRAFFYLVRWDAGGATGTWGAGSAGGERAGAGGCL